MYARGGQSEYGIAGNDNPLVIALGQESSEEGSSTPGSSTLNDGVLDELRLSSVRRDFSLVAP